MRLLLCATVIAAMTAGCEQPAPPSLDGATVRRVDSGAEGDQRFEIRVPGDGWLGVGLGPMNSDSIMWMSTRATDDKTIELRVEREEIAVDTIMERFVSPLYGEDAVEQLRAQKPEAGDLKLVLTTIVLEQRSASGASTSRMGPIATVISAGGSSTSTMLADTQAIDAGPLRLAAWLHVPRQPGGMVGIGIGPDEVKISAIGGDLTLKEAGAVFEELTLRFTEELPRLARR